jgi:regulatory protein
LQSRQSNKSDVEAVISRLKEYGYLDDERFAFSYASLKVKQRPIGRRRLERDLKFKKVDSAVANEALELVYTETTEEELIDRAIEKRIRLRGKPQDRLAAKSLFDHLLRQGFPFELVSEKVRAVSKQELDE